MRSTRHLLPLLLIAALAPQSQATVTDLASSPLETASPGQAKPNILYVLDDSGSMDYAYLPDWASTSTATLFRNSRYNGLYYNAAVTYSPPVYYDGSSYPSMSSSNTSAWTKVPDDGFGVQSTSTSNLVGNAYFYTFVAGEYCSDVHQASCSTLSVATTAYPYPAYVRWCSDTALSDCQVTYVNTAPTGGQTYTQLRYPPLRDMIWSGSPINYQGGTTGC